MSENEGFILKAEQFSQEEWCEMFRRVSETCKDLRTENECLQNQLQQKESIIKEFENKGYDIAQERADFLLEIQRLENIIKEIREYIRSNEWGIDYEHSSCRTHLLEILDKAGDEK